MAWKNMGLARFLQSCRDTPRSNCANVSIVAQLPDAIHGFCSPILVYYPFSSACGLVFTNRAAT